MFPHRALECPYILRRIIRVKQHLPLASFHLLVAGSEEIPRRPVDEPDSPSALVTHMIVGQPSAMMRKRSSLSRSASAARRRSVMSSTQATRYGGCRRSLVPVRPLRAPKPHAHCGGCTAAPNLRIRVDPATTPPCPPGQYPCHRGGSGPSRFGRAVPLRNIPPSGKTPGSRVLAGRPVRQHTCPAVRVRRPRETLPRLDRSCHSSDTQVHLAAVRPVSFIGRIGSFQPISPTKNNSHQSAQSFRGY